MGDLDLFHAGLWSELRLREQRERDRGAPWAEALSPLTIEWLDDNDEAIGSRYSVQVPPVVAVEHPGLPGSMTATALPQPLRVADARPAGAVAARLFFAGEFLAKKEMRPPPPAGYAALAGYETDRMGAAAPRFILHVVAERFSDRDRFLGRVDEFWGAIMAARPFNRQGVRDRLALAWHFAPAFDADGHFETRDPVQGVDAHYDARLFMGDRARAEELLRPLASASSGAMVLINSRIGGGAGGSVVRWQGHDYYYPSWSSIKSRRGEQWWQMCLHELGHGLGLGDEYSHAYPDADFDPLDPAIALEGNVSRTGALADVKWPVNVPAAHHADWRQIPALAQDPDTVAAFEGARYTPHGLYRPMLRCRMNQTWDEFCDVCQELIAERIASP